MNKYDFESLLNKLTVHELDELARSLYSEFNSYPAISTADSKPQILSRFTRWVIGNSTRVNRVVELTNKKINEKAMYPTSGPVSGTHYIALADFQKLPSFGQLIEAIEFPYKAGAKPITKDGYLSVSSIYNISAWANWKSSSLSDYERSKAEAIHSQLNLVALMNLNKGRRMDQPALFPVNMLK